MKTHFLLSASLFIVFSVPAIAQCTGHAQLNGLKEPKLVQVFLGQQSKVSAQFLSEPGRGKPVLDSLKSLGAKID